MTNVNEISKTDIEVIEKETSVLLRQADSYVIKSTQDVDLASGFLRKLKDAENVIEAKRTEFTQPINQSLRSINETFKKLSRPLAEARLLVTNKILEWRRAENERLAKEEERRRKIQEAHKEKGHEVKAPIVLERPEKKVGNTQVRKVWTWQVVDYDKVPDIYKELNMTAINQAVRDGIREISGLRIYQEEKLSII